MEYTRRRRPRGLRTDPRLIWMGVAGFLVLAGVFFVGFLIGPRLGTPAARTKVETVQRPTYVPPPPPATPEPDASEEPAVDIEITEHADTPSAQGDQAADEGVRRDENGLTLTLEPEGEKKAAEDAVQPEKSPPAPPEPPKPEPERKQSPPKPPAPTTKRPEPERSALERPRAATETKPSASVPQTYRVHVGAYRNKTNADILAAELKERGYRAAVATVEVNGAKRYRVQLGKYKTKEDAQELAKDLSAVGYSPTVFSEPRTN